MIMTKIMVILNTESTRFILGVNVMLQSNFIVKIKGHLKPLYEITNSAMAANKEVIGYQFLILFLIFTTQDWYKFTNWQIFYIGKSGNRPNTLLTIGKLLVEITM